MLTSAQRSKLEAFIAKSQFAETQMYVGYRSQDAVADPDALLNGIAARLLKRGSYTKMVFVEDAVNALKPLDEAVTEDREQACAAVERLMAVLHIESSDGQLNRALYGFNP